MARPRSDVRPVCLKPSLRLYPGVDDDLISFLDQAQEDGLSLAQAVITAMRGGLRQAQPTAEIDEDETADALFDLFV